MSGPSPASSGPRAGAAAGPAPAAPPPAPPPRAVLRRGAGAAGALALASAGVAAGAAGAQLGGGCAVPPAALGLVVAGLQLARLTLLALAAATQWTAGLAARAWAREEARLGSLNISGVSASLRGSSLWGTPNLGFSHGLPLSAESTLGDPESGTSTHLFSHRETAARGGVQERYQRLNMVLDFELFLTLVGLVPVAVVYLVLSLVELGRAPCAAVAADGLNIASLVLCLSSLVARAGGGPMPLQWRPLLGTGPEAQLVWEAHYMGRVEQWLRQIMLFMGAPKYYWFFFSKSAELGAAAHPVAMGAAKIFTSVRAKGGTSLLEFLSVLNALRKEDTLEQAEIKREEAGALTKEDMQVGRWAVPQARSRERGLPPVFSGRALPDDPDLRLTVAVQEAASMVRFSTACYSGIQLDLLRHKKSFLFFLLRRQEIVWTLLGFGTNRCDNPVSDPTGEIAPYPAQGDTNAEKKPPGPGRILKGDNPWQGNARAFCRYAHIELGDLRGGRIGKRKVRAEAFNLASGLLAYFISTVRDTRCVVVAVRGTGDLNDVLLDLSAYEIAVTAEDLGLPEDQNACKRWGWAHFGVLNAVRELARELTGEDGQSGPLNDLLGPGGECEGWDLRVVGQSLGGAVAGLMALRLRRLFPAVRGICYNPLPVLDSQAIAAVGADACRAHCLAVCYANDVVSRLTFPAVSRLADRIEEHLLEKKGRQRGCCAVPGCLRPYGWLNELACLGCGYCLFCYFNAAENVDDTVTSAGRAIVAQDYPYTPPGAISSTSTPRGDGTPPPSPARSRSWKPKLLTMGGSSSKTPQVKMHKKPRASRGSSKPRTKPEGSGAPGVDATRPGSETPRGASLGVSEPQSIGASRGRPAEEAAPPRRPVGPGDEPPGDVGPSSMPGAVGDVVRHSSFNSQISNHSAKLQFSGPQFLLFGDIVHLQPITPSKEHANAKENMWKASFKFPDDFVDISLADDFIANHFPWHLEAALGWVCGQTREGTAGRARKKAGAAPGTVKGRV